VETLTRDTIRLVHVDDDPDFAELSARRLKRAGFNQPVVHCPDGIRALGRLSTFEPKSAPHVILLDLQMPGMDGLELLQWIREKYGDRDAAVYLLTSSVNPEHRRRAEAQGVTAFLIKSFSLEDLVEKLDLQIAKLNSQSHAGVPTKIKKSPVPEHPRRDRRLGKTSVIKMGDVDGQL
jgi:CheY-like chemotaxis protein